MKAFSLNINPWFYHECISTRTDNNRCRKAKTSGSWTEDEMYDLIIAFDKFKDQKVLMRQKYKHGEITLQELNNWFISQRDVIDAIMMKHGM